MKKVSLTLTGLAVTLPTIVFAQDISGKVPCQGLECAGTGEVATILQNIINWIFGFAALVAVLFIIIGGILYVVSAGNTDRAKQARQTILYSVIGLLIIVLSYFVVSLVLNTVVPALT